MLFRPRLVRHVRRPSAPLGQRAFINQVPGVQRAMRAQMAQDFNKVSTLVFLPPLMALGYIASFSIFGFFGVQWWLEHVDMAPGETSAWEWEKEIEDWSGGIKGGTDPSLGFIPRLGLRSAWLFQHWAGSISQSSSSSSSYIPKIVLSGPDRGYQLAEQQVAWVIRYLKERNKPIPNVIILRHADLLTRLGTPRALKDAKLVYIRLYKAAPPNSLEAAQLALKIGNLASLDGSDDAALEYYLKALFYKGGGTQAALSPIEQRHYANTAVQISDWWSNQDNLRTANEMQQEMAGRIGTFFPPPPFEPKDPSEIAHYAYLGNRVNLLFLHFAEVAYARAYGPDPMFPLEQTIPYALGLLSDTAKGSSVTFMGLCNHSPSSEPIPGDAQQSLVPMNNEPLKEFSKSRSLKEPTISLLRASRRTAIHSYRLIGMIQENRDDNAAMQAYEMALRWAGMTVADGKKLGIPETEVIDVQRRLNSLQSRLSAKL